MANIYLFSINPYLCRWGLSEWLILDSLFRVCKPNSPQNSEDLRYKEGNVYKYLDYPTNIGLG